VKIHREKSFDSYGYFPGKELLKLQAWLDLPRVVGTSSHSAFRATFSPASTGPIFALRLLTGSDSSMNISLLMLSARGNISLRVPAIYFFTKSLLFSGIRRFAKDQIKPLPWAARIYPSQAQQKRLKWFVFAL
jgi:hypothetical protein